MSRSGKKRRKHHPGEAAAGHVPDAPEQETPTGSFGAMLLRARKERGLSHDDVARDTRVAKRYVLALENESLSGLPGGLYNRAYLRACAVHLGLDADLIVRDYDRTVQEQSGNGGVAAQPDQIDALRAVIKQKESRTPATNGAAGTVKGPVFIGMALLVLAGGAWLGARHLSSRAETMPTQLRTTDAVASDTVARNGAIVGNPATHVPADSELHVSDSANEPGPLRAAPVDTLPAKTPDSPVPQVRQAPTSISVNDSGVGTDVVERKLVGRSETFAAGTRIVFWTSVIGGRPGDIIRHAWFHRGRPVATVKLPVRAANWRTHSQRVLAPGADGEWIVEAQDEQGRVLARHAFRSGL